MTNENLSEIICKNVKQISVDNQIAGTLLKVRKTLTSGHPNHFFLKELVNPQQAYWEIIGKKPKVSKELQTAFDYGTMMHNRAGFFFSKLPGFSCSEGVLDGAAVGLTGIRGRCDFRFGEALLEFKTTKKKVDTEQEVWQNVPQDIEQLLFYSALWTLESDKHYIVFYTEDDINPIRAFSVTISDPGKIKNTLKQRQNALQKAIDEGKPEQLKKCRYHNHYCPMQEEEICSCDSYEKWSTSVLQSASTLQRNYDMEKLLLDSWKSVDQVRPIVPWDLEVPRRTYGWLTAEKPEKSKSRFPDNWIWSALQQSELTPGPIIIPSLPQLSEPLLFKASGTYLIHRISKGKSCQESIIPGLIREWDHDYTPQPKYLKNHLMQLGVLCSFSDCENGALILSAPLLKDDVFVFIVQFKNLVEIKKETKLRLTKLAEAVTSKSINNLPKCPKWLQVKECQTCGLCIKQKKRK